MFKSALKNIKFLELKIQNYSHSLYEEERGLITKAPSKRINEFSTGRYGIRQLLKYYGINHFPIKRDQNGMPIFPGGIIGSISHSDKKCFVAMSTDNEYRSIGIDIEEYSKLDLNLCRYFLHKNEIELVNKQIGVYQQIIAATLFSVKEAFYKMQYSISKSYLDFLDAQVSFIEAGSLQFRVLCDIGIDTDNIEAYYSFDTIHVYTLVLYKN